MRHDHDVNALERMAGGVARGVGSTAGFCVAVALVAAWAISGPLFGFSDTWQLLINTSTTIVTFLMVVLIQRSQNKESLAVQLKLDELLATKQGASPRMIDVENMSEADLERLRDAFRKLASAGDAGAHSVEEALEEKR